MLFHKRVRNCVYHLLKRFSFFAGEKNAEDFLLYPPLTAKFTVSYFVIKSRFLGYNTHAAIDCFIFCCDRMKGEDDLTIRGIAFASSNYSSIVCWWAWNLYCGWFCYLQKYCHKNLLVLSYTPHEIRLTSPEKFQLHLKEELTNSVTVWPLYFDINWIWVVAKKVS